MVAAAKPPDQAIHTVTVAAIQLFERRQVSAPGQVNQLQIVVSIVD
jgi:hypothetical protein